MKKYKLLVLASTTLALVCTSSHPCSAADATTSTEITSDAIVSSGVVSFAPEVIRGEPCTFPWSSTTTNQLVARLCLRHDVNPTSLPHGRDFLIGIGTNGITWTPPSKEVLADGIYVASIEPLNSTGEATNSFSFYLGSPTPKTASLR